MSKCIKCIFREVCNMLQDETCPKYRTNAVFLVMERADGGYAHIVNAFTTHEKAKAFIARAFTLSVHDEARSKWVFRGHEIWIEERAIEE